MYGYYALEDGEHVIVMPHSNNYEQALKEQKPIPKISVKHTIDYNTIGQYTGLKDKNGKEIYEGDIVKIIFKEKDIGKVIYEHNGFTIDVMNMNRTYGRVSFVNNFMEVIGNIHDNPELLEVQDE